MGESGDGQADFRFCHKEILTRGARLSAKVNVKLFLLIFPFCLVLALATLSIFCYPFQIPPIIKNESRQNRWPFSRTLCNCLINSAERDDRKDSNFYKLRQVFPPCGSPLSEKQNRAECYKTASCCMAISALQAMRRKPQ